MRIHADADADQQHWLRGHTPIASPIRSSDVRFLRFEPHQAKHEHDIPQCYLKALPLLKFPTAYSKAL